MVLLGWKGTGRKGALLWECKDMSKLLLFLVALAAVDASPYLDASADTPNTNSSSCALSSSTAASAASAVWWRAQLSDEQCAEQGHGTDASCHQYVWDLDEEAMARVARIKSSVRQVLSASASRKRRGRLIRDLDQMDELYAAAPQRGGLQHHAHRRRQRNRRTINAPNQVPLWTPVFAVHRGFAGTCRRPPTARALTRCVCRKARSAALNSHAVELSFGH